MKNTFESMVEPRAYSPRTGEPQPLIDLILEELDTKNRTIRIVGEGTRTAIEFLQQALKDYANVHVVHKQEAVKPASQWDLVVFSSSGLNSRPLAGLELKLTKWGEDEVIEYLLNRSPERCKSVMRRLQESNDLSLGNGSPRVLTIALDQLIKSENVQSIEDGILKHFREFDLQPRYRAEVTSHCMNHLFFDEQAFLALKECSPHLVSIEEVKFLANQSVRYVIGAEEIIHWLEENQLPAMMSGLWPQALVKMIADKIQDNAPAKRFLDELANNKESRSASNAASLLIAADKNWKPTINRKQAFENARLANVNWPDQSFIEAALTQADLSHSNLQNSDFEEATLTGGNFSKSCTSGANFTYAYAAYSNFSGSNARTVSAHGACFPHANFSMATLESSNLSSTNFNKSDLSNANLSKCNLKRAQLLDAKLDYANFSDSILIETSFQNSDLQTARIDGADFSGASFVGCDLSYQQPVGVTFQMVEFKNSLLTETVFQNGNLRNANLLHAKMAGIVWENCDLRGANICNCQFNLGSTRCGTLDSPFPSHGSKTGYYTDDFDEHFFKPPEERRVASLRGCNLLGANVFHTDFYLVDLRGSL